jgi:hypothetical protein
MVGEAGDIVVGVLRAEGVQHQERVQPALQVLRQQRLSLTPAPSLVG